jgi:hypothetical protein
MNQKNNLAFRRRRWPRASIQIEIETSKKRITNIEVMYSVYLKETERARFAKLATQAKSDSTLRHSIFDILRFCGSLLMKLHIRFMGSTFKLCIQAINMPFTGF